MGLTRFSGPLYGAKSLLLAWSGDLASEADANTFETLIGVNVPSYEDWIVTEMRVWRGSTQSTASVYRLVDDSTVVANVSITSSAAGVAGSTIISRTAGEYEGYVVEAGSSLTITATPGSSGIASTGNRVLVYGFIRFKSSTRAE